jgi:hypothetical protein
MKPFLSVEANQAAERSDRFDVMMLSKVRLPKQINASVPFTTWISQALKIELIEATNGVRLIG